MTKDASFHRDELAINARVARDSTSQKCVKRKVRDHALPTKITTNHFC